MPRIPKRPTLLIRTSDNAPLFEGIVSECDALGWQVINLTYMDNYIAFKDSPIGAIFEKQKPSRTMHRLREMGVPTVRIWSPMQSDFGCDACFAEDRRAGGRLAADAFAERGFTELGYVAFGAEVPTDELYVGYREQAESLHNASVHLCHFTKEGASEEEGYELFVKDVAVWLAERPKPLAMFAHNFKMAIRILAACERAGLSVPEQVAIACRGNDEGLCRTSLVPMSAIDMNVDEIGRQAVRMVRRLADGEAPLKETIHIPVKGFVARRSTDILAVSDPTVAKAMRFMWDHLDLPLSVDDIAFEVNASRATLERAFSRTLGRGIMGELRRKRLEVCKEMLRGTRMPLAAIAEAVGMGSRRHLHRAFKDAFGMTPQEFRLSDGPKTS